eukprot:gnl/MRDRNA2_/MRDRNA2_69037_c0_seq3.p1 gnl/MRDRNA2_/MRDRNA2_69037_c0~~gnl/MRDRNA2_/MRDRNA2_69037_c0_seq3.p1  ORF type:complete len:263 (-),score=71.05 gnl/MRDRNA2_/MRDRNA2_69037_c0_seq3:71-859(-)
MDDAEKLKLMISASFTTAKYLKENDFKHPFVITSDTGVLEEMKLAGITEYFATCTDDGTVAKDFADPEMKGGGKAIGDIIREHPNVDCVVVGWDLGLTAKKAGTAINFIKWHEELHTGDPDFRRMPIIVCSGDTGGVLGVETVGGKQLKFRAIGNGAMADIIARSFDPHKPWIDLGKPSAALGHLLQSPNGYQVDTSKALMVGDTLETDIVFGHRTGMKTLLVLTGVTSQQDLKESVEAGVQERIPSYVLPKLGVFVESGKI